MTTTVADAGFAGWWRPGRAARWSRVAVADTYDDAWGKTLDALASVRGGESLVVRLDENPNARQRRKATARRTTT